MLKKISIASALLLASGATAANPAIDAVNNQWTVSVGKQRMDYHEMDNSNVVPTRYLDSETGSQPWIGATFSKQLNIRSMENIFLKASVAFASGHTTYNGYLDDPGHTPHRGKTDTTTFDTDFKVGKGFLLGSHVQVTPYVSYGIHVWNRDMEEHDKAHGSIETYSHSAYSFGTMGQFAFTPDLVLNIDGSVGRTSGGRMHSNYTDDDYELGSRTVTTLDLGLTYLAGKNWTVNGGYRLCKFSYGQSPAVNAYIEPESTTKLQTIYLGVGHKF
jgi:hypothetical protein